MNSPCSALVVLLVIAVNVDQRPGSLRLGSLRAKRGTHRYITAGGLRF